MFYKWFVFVFCLFLLFCIDVDEECEYELTHDRYGRSSRSPESLRYLRLGSSDRKTSSGYLHNFWFWNNVKKNLFKNYYLLCLLHQFFICDTHYALYLYLCEKMHLLQAMDIGKQLEDDIQVSSVVQRT